ncbi:MAG: hypothetical protein ACLP5E_21915 [Streptosporangiaceae bacterium]
MIHSTGKAHSPPADAIAGYVIELARGSVVWPFELFVGVLAGGWRIATLLANQLVMIRPGLAR